MFHENRKPVLLFLALILLFFSGCAQQPKKPQLTRVNIAFQEWVGYGPFYLGEELGFFKNEGIDLAILDVQLDSSRRDAFQQGMLDCEAGTLDLLVSKAAQGVQISAVAELDYSFGSDGIVAAGKIKGLEDLKGRRVVLGRDDVGETFLSYLLNERGIAFNDLIILSEQPQNVARDFLDAKADACVTWEPHLSAALKRPGSHILATSREYPGIIIDTLNVRQDLIKDNPGLVKKLMRAWFKTLKFYQENPEGASQIIAKYYKITPREYRKQVEGLRWVGYEEQRKISAYDKWLKVFNTIAELKFLNKRITVKPIAGKFVDHSLLESLYENSR